MKIAKKVLAVVMAIAMIGCLTAMAFAATGSIKLVAGEVKDGKLKVAIVAENCKGLTSADLTITYDASVLTFKSVAPGADALKLGSDKTPDNVFSGLGNGKDAGKILYGFNFLENLGFEATNMEGDTIDYNVNNFEVAVINFTVKEGAASTEIKLEGTAKDADPAFAGTTVKLAAEPSTEAPTKAPETTVAPTEAPSTKEATTKAANPNTGNVKTGDNMALAAAAGVVALAGAAFIISKKRK